MEKISYIEKNGKVTGLNINCGDFIINIAKKDMTIECAPGRVVKDAMEKAIKYLKEKDLNGEYCFVANTISVKISATSNVEEVYDYYIKFPNV